MVPGRPLLLLLLLLFCCGGDNGSVLNGLLCKSPLMRLGIEADLCTPDMLLGAVGGCCRMPPASLTRLPLRERGKFKPPPRFPRLPPRLPERLPIPCDVPGRDERKMPPPPLLPGVPGVPPPRDRMLPRVLPRMLPRDNNWSRMDMAVPGRLSVPPP